MNGPEDNKFEKYWETSLMLLYFWIPFFGLKRALKIYTETDNLPFMSIVLILFISGNIISLMILWLNDKTLLAKSLWAAALLLMMVVLNLVVM
jgi:hypothetical protein